MSATTCEICKKRKKKFYFVSKDNIVDDHYGKSYEVRLCPVCDEKYTVHFRIGWNNTGWSSGLQCGHYIGTENAADNVIKQQIKSYYLEKAIAAHLLDTHQIKVGEEYYIPGGHKYPKYLLTRVYLSCIIAQYCRQQLEQGLIKPVFVKQIMFYPK